ncbi:MAG: hypothetical protein HY820_26185 [Acidobacteria bacterium]|nr:hypothetical protein [Acidobacteriota bacterium]
MVVRANGNAYPVNIVSSDRASCPRVIRVVLPNDLPLGSAEIEAVFSQVVIGPTPIRIVSTRFGFLPRKPDSLSRPARGGTSMALAGTGIGNAGPADIRASFGGQPILIDSLVRGIEPGIDELRFRLPATLVNAGCYVPVEMVVRGVAVNTSSVAASQTGEPCRHPLGLGREQLAVLDAGRSIPIGVIGSSSSFQAANASAVEAATGPQFAQPRYQCTMGSGISVQRAQSPFAYLDAGRLHLISAAGEQLNPPFPSLSPGSWSFQFTGGIDIPPFSGKFNVARPAQLIDAESEFVYGPDEEIRVRWDPTGYDPLDEITITLNRANSALRCVAPVRDGARTLPIGALLLDMPSSSPWSAGLILSVAPRPGANPTFPFRLVNGVESAAMLRFPVSSTYTIRLREAVP